MEIYSTEEQQVEAIKKFWSDYGNAIIGGIILGLSGIGGYNWYSDKQVSEREATSIAYEDAIKSTDNQNIATFVNQNSESGYAVLAAFQLAKSFADEKKYKESAEQLTWIVANAEDASIKELATLRLAKVKFAQGEIDNALALISAEATAYKAQYLELKGDILLKSGKVDEARVAYQQAVDLSGQNVNPTLKLKLNDLAQPSAVVAL